MLKTNIVVSSYPGFYLGLTLVFACLGLMGCKITVPASTEFVSEKTVTISKSHQSYGTGINSVWFDISTGAPHPWGSKETSEPPDTLQSYFKITPKTGLFKAPSLQNQLHFGALFLGKGDSLYQKDYLGDSLDLRYDLNLLSPLDQDNVYYLRNQVSACQIKIIKWDPVSESLVFDWRVIDNVNLDEYQQTISLPQENTNKLVYFFNIKESKVAPVSDMDSLTEPSVFEFRINPASSPYFSTPFYPNNPNFGIAYLGLGESFYYSSQGWENRLNHSYEPAVLTDKFKLGSVFYLRTYQGDCKIMITHWDVNTSRLEFKWIIQTDLIH